MVYYLYASCSPWTFERSDGFSWNLDMNRYFCRDQHTTKSRVKGMTSNWKGRSKKHTPDISLFILNGSSNKVTKNITNKMNSHGWPIQTGDHSILCSLSWLHMFQGKVYRLYLNFLQRSLRWRLSSPFFLAFWCSIFGYWNHFHIPQSLCHSRRCDKNVLNPVLHVVKRNYASYIKEYYSWSWLQHSHSNTVILRATLHNTP